MKIAYVLSGGGAKGAFQVGVMKKLHEQGIQPDVIYGTSVGAINAAGYAYDNGIVGLEQQWLNVVGKKWYMPWTPSPDVLGFNWGILFFGCADGIYNTKPLHDHLTTMCVGTPLCEAIACSVSLNTSVVRYISNKTSPIADFVNGVEASGTIPGMMSPVGEWVDGGVRKVLPLEKALLDGGYDKIYVISCNPLVQNNPELYDVSKQFPFFKFLNVAYRAIDGAMEQEIMIGNADQCFNNTSGIPLEIYAPSVVPCSTLDFTPATIVKNIAMGYDAKPLTLVPLSS